MKNLRPTFAALLVLAAGTACEPPAPTTPITVGEKVPSKHGAAKAAGSDGHAAGAPGTPGGEELGAAPEGMPSPHGGHGTPGMPGMDGVPTTSAISKASPATVILKIDDVEFTKADLSRAMAQAAALAGVPPDMLDAQMRAAFEQPAYEKLIERHLLVKEAKRRKLWPDDAEAKAKRAEMLKTLPEGKTLDDILKAMGVDEKSFDEDLRVDVAIAKLLKDVEAKVPAPPKAAIDDIYQNNKAVFTIPDTAAAAHILVKVDRASGPAVIAEKKKIADEIKASVVGKDDAAFAAVAKEKSDDPSGKARGGDLGMFKRGDLFPEFEAVAFKLKEGEIAGPVQTDRGFHIIRGGGVQLGRTLPAKEAKDIIIERERVKTFLAAVDDLVDELRKGATTVRVMEPVPSPLIDANGRGSRVPNWRASGKNAVKNMGNPHGPPPGVETPTPSSKNHP
jgi:parvulin-like peptidyl-prolyl isomerase